MCEFNPDWGEGGMMGKLLQWNIILLCIFLPVTEKKDLLILFLYFLKEAQ